MSALFDFLFLFWWVIYLLFTEAAVVSSKNLILTLLDRLQSTQGTNLIIARNAHSVYVCVKWEEEWVDKNVCMMGRFWERSCYTD